MKKTRLLITAVLACFFGASQTDTILVYDINTHNTFNILPVQFNSLVTSGHSSSSVGAMGGLASLPQTPPSTNTFSNSSFSKLAHATDFFTLTDYPVRTVINLQTHMDTLHYIGTGMMVGPCFVLTSAANIHDFFAHAFWLFDSIRAVPAVNNGLPQPGLPSSLVKKIYRFKSFDQAWDDIALLELKEPIGQKIGWTGFGFDNTPNFTNGKVFHKFSYPSHVSPFDSSKVYNGDTLYYNYGSIIDQGMYLGIPSGEANAIPGQGGSTFLYKDTWDYYSVGICSFSANYFHYKITNKAFYQMQNVLSTQVCDAGTMTALGEHGLQDLPFELFPNPVANETFLQFAYDPAEQYTMKIMNVLGQVVTEDSRISGGRVRIPCRHLQQGIYLLELRTEKGASSTRRLIVE